MAITMGIEIRRYATVTVDTDDMDEANQMAANMVLEDDPSVDWNQPEVEYQEVICQTDDGDSFSDRAYQERRERICT